MGSYGRQLGRIGDALGVLIKHIRPEDLSDDEKKKMRPVTAFGRYVKVLLSANEFVFVS